MRRKWRKSGGFEVQVLCLHYSVVNAVTLNAQARFWGKEKQQGRDYFGNIGAEVTIWSLWMLFHQNRLVPSHLQSVLGVHSEAFALLDWGYFIKFVKKPVLCIFDTVNVCSKSNIYIIWESIMYFISSWFYTEIWVKFFIWGGVRFFRPLWVSTWLLCAVVWHWTYSPVYVIRKVMGKV